MFNSLDERLKTVFKLINANTHADIGSDHAYLPITLVQAGRVSRCLIVELNEGPLKHAQTNVDLAGLADKIEVRYGNGFSPILPNEVQSASITGMGSKTILGILRARQATGESLPAVLVLQPNDSAHDLRAWAQVSGYHLSAEELVKGFWFYPVLRLEQRLGPDPTYQDLSPETALRYGPLLLKRRDALLKQQVLADIQRLSPIAVCSPQALQDLAEARAALAILESFNLEY